MSLGDRSPRRSDFYPKAQITLNGCPKNAGRCPKDASRTIVQLAAWYAGLAVVAALVVAVFTPVIMRVHNAYAVNGPLVLGTDMGGSLDEYITFFEELRRENRRVVIDGMCRAANPIVALANTLLLKQEGIKAQGKQP